MKLPDKAKLYESSVKMADLMGLRCFSREEANELFYHLLSKAQEDGGKEIWECLKLGLVTKI